MSFWESPIQFVYLPGINVALKGLIVLVGPNSSGKTNLLRDIHAAASGLTRELVVANQIHFRSVPHVNEYLEFFKASGDIEEISQPGQNETYIRRGHQYGGSLGGGPGGTFSRTDIENSHRTFVQYVQTVQGKNIQADAFLQRLGLFECSALFIEQRLALTQAAANFDALNAPTETALQALRRNIEAQKSLTAEMQRVFKRGVWLDLSGGATIPIRVSDTDYVPSFEERSDPQQMKSYRTIETEGEGLRSYTAVCVTLLLARRSLCLIDEPEMCLHPPQARALGRFIGKYGSNDQGCIVVATHDSGVLRGILESNPRATVIRLTRSKGGFYCQHVSAETLAGATTRPFSRSELILDGLFTDGVVLCESDGDRLVYESTLQTISAPQPDLRFIPVGGIGGFREPIQLYRALKAPVAIAADFDFLFKPELSAALTALGAPSDAIDELSIRINNFMASMRAVEPELSVDAAVEETKPLLNDVANWKDLKSEALLKSKLNRLLGRLNRLPLLKRKGIEGVPEDMKTEPQSILSELQKFGLFLVPRGELESWVPELMGNTTKVNKSLWATEAALRIEDKGRGNNDIWDFVVEIINFIKSQLGQ
jgi:hypothetical protein